MVTLNSVTLTTESNGHSSIPFHFAYFGGYINTAYQTSQERWVTNRDLWKYLITYYRLNLYLHICKWLSSLLHLDYL